MLEENTRCSVLTIRFAQSYIYIGLFGNQMIQDHVHVPKRVKYVDTRIIDEPIPPTDQGFVFF